MGASEVASLGRSAEPAGPFEIVLDVSGNPDAIGSAERLVAPGGRIILIGSSRGVSPGLRHGAIASMPVEIRGAHAQMRPDRESSPGRWTFQDEAGLYLDLVSAGRLVPFDPPVEHLDPREAWSFYRRLGNGEPPVGAALFDWERIPDAQRHAVTSLRLPGDVWKTDPAAERGRSRRSPAGGARRRAVAPVVPARRHEEGEGMLRIAMIGCGEIALKNARAVAESGAARIRWAIDTNLALARDLTRRCGGEAGSDPEAAFEGSDVDAVFICTPHDLHASLGQRAARAGKHLIVEKPLARNADEARSLIRAAHDSGVHVATCYPMRFLPQVIAARTLVREGGLGRIVGIKIAEHLYKEMSYWHGGATGRSRSNWRASRDRSGGGVLLMNLSHHLDVLMFITGLQARRVYCEQDRFAAPGDIEDLVALTLRMTDGSIASIDASTCAPGGGERTFQIWGSDGQLALDEPPRYLSLRKSSLGQPNEWRHLPIGGEREARRDFVRAFAAAALRGGPNPAPPEASLAVQDLIDAAYESARRGEPVGVDGIPEKSADVVSGT